MLASLLFAFSGCGKSTPSADTQSGPATLTLVNLSNYPWQITFTTTSGEQVNTTQLAAKSSSTIHLPADSYAVTQRVALSATEPALTRSLTVRFASGQTYRWPLDTLLSQSAGDPSRMLPPPHP